jgi:LPXTG-motif cell wall-anchored protein
VGRQQIVILGVVLGLIGALGTVPTSRAQGQSLSVNLAGQNNSGIAGTATLTELGGGKIRVEIRVTGAGAGPQPAHIHNGTCAQLDPAPRFNLASVTNGASTTEIDGTLQQLTSAQHAIHLHKSQEELPVYVACADLRASTQPATLPRTGSAGPLLGTMAGISGLGLSLVAAGYALRRRARRL